MPIRGMRLGVIGLNPAQGTTRAVLTPGNSQVWYSTVLSFLAEHVLDQEWQRPELL